MTQHRRIYLDMDGTLFRFHDTEHEYIERMWEPGFYRNLKPFQNLVDAVRMFMSRNPDTEIYILSAVLPTKSHFIEEEKCQSLRKHLPEIPEDHMLFIPAGSDKSAYLSGIDANCYLIDDYNKNLREWADAGGRSVKFINDINNKGLGAYGGEVGNLWKGFSIRHNQNPLDLCMDIEAFTGILPYSEQKMNGFEGDVSIEDMCSHLIGYFFFRQQLDILRPQTLPGYNRPPETYQEALLFLNSTPGDEPVIQNYCTEHNISPAEHACLETCLQACTVSEMTPAQMYNYLLASIKAGEWYGNPPTPASLKQFVRRISQRNRRLMVLDYTHKRLSAIEAQINIALYTPTSRDIRREILSDGKYRDSLQSQLQSLADDKADVQTQWEQLTGLAYPKIPYGSKAVSFEFQRQREKEKDIPLL